MAIINVEEIARETELSVAASLESIARQIRARHASTSDEAAIYDRGGPLKGGVRTVTNTSDEPERIISQQEVVDHVAEVADIDTAPEKPKRKRRTKAQIEADNAAAAAAAESEARAEATAPVEDEGPDENVDTEAATSTDEESDWAPEWPT